MTPAERRAQTQKKYRGTDEAKSRDAERKAQKRANIKAEKEAQREKAKNLSALEPDARTSKEPVSKKRKTLSLSSKESTPELEEPVSDLTPAVHKSHHRGSIRARTRDIRMQVNLWSCDWGPENTWEIGFQRRLKKARQTNQVDAFFEDLEVHAKKGRSFLHMLKNVGAGECLGDIGVLLDLFTQGIEMGIQVASEVKFFEVKLDEYAPVASTNAESEFRYYDSEDMNDD